MIQLGSRSYIIFSLGFYPHETAKANKIYLIETFSRARVGKYLFNMFPTRDGLNQGDVLSPLLFNFPFE